MSTGFKGSVVKLTNITLSGGPLGPVLSVKVQFMEPSGVVHAITQHELEPSVEPGISEATRILMEALTKWVERLHYEQPSDPEQGTSRGISESLRKATDDTDGLGSQG